jgi:hypothetical protein
MVASASDNRGDDEGRRRREQRGDGRKAQAPPAIRPGPRAPPAAEVP